MRIHAVEHGAADTASGMASAAGVLGMTAEAARRLRAGVDGMAHQKVSAVDLARLDALGTPSLNQHVLRDVVT
jgi:hypothetical protein